MEPDAAVEGSEPGPHGAQKKKFHPLASRIKRLMQTDEDVGKIAQATPHLIALATEQFLRHLAGGALRVAEGRSAKTLQPAHMKAFVKSEAVLDFLKDAVAAAPDLPADEPKPGLKPRRKRVRKPEAESEAACEGEVKEGGGEEVPSPRRRAKRPSRAGAGKRKGAAAEEAVAAEVKSEDVGVGQPAEDSHEGDGWDTAAAVKVEPGAYGADPGGSDVQPHAPFGEGIDPDPGGWHSAEEAATADRHGGPDPGHVSHDAGQRQLAFTYADDPPEAAAASEYGAQPENPSSEPTGGEGGTQAGAVQQVEGCGPAGSAGAEVDELDVPMVWLEPPGAGPAVEDEDYD